MTLILPLAEKNRILEHAVETYPNECCGFILGKSGDLHRVTTIRRVRNTKEGNQRRRYLIDPSDYRKAEKYALDQDLDLIGVYHSHPDHPAEPSEHDRKFALPWFSYIIVSVEDGSATVLRSWHLEDDGSFSEESVKTVSKQQIEQIDQKKFPDS